MPCENLPAYCYPDQQSIVRGWIKSVHKEEFNIDMGARLGHRKWFSKSEDIPTMHGH